MEQLIVFRIVQGLGAGGLFVSVLAIIGELFTPREGAKYYGMFGMVFAGASLAGPAVGGLLTDALSWHWVFLVNLPVGAVIVALLVKYLHLPGRPPRAPSSTTRASSRSPRPSSPSPCSRPGAASSTPGPPRRSSGSASAPWSSSDCS